MSSLIAKLVGRVNLVRLKCTGRLPQISLPEVVLMLSRPNRRWPTQKLAVPRRHAGEKVTFDTPIGPISWDLDNRKSLGLLVFEELCGTYECDSVKVAKGDIVVDLGAHVGTFTRFALKCGAARVIALEPEPSHVALLHETFAAEIRQGIVSIIAAAASKEEGQAQFQSDGVGSKISHTGTLTVPMTTVDEVVKRLGLGRVDFIKADIEGAERHALLGAAKTIKQYGPRMAICIYHFCDDPQILPEIVLSIRPYQVAMNVAREQAYFYTGT